MEHVGTEQHPGEWAGRLYRSPLLTAMGVRHGFTTRRGGVSIGRHASLNLGATWGDDPAAVAENLRRVASEGGFCHDELCQVAQVHGTQVVAVSALEQRKREADGMVTDRRLALGVLSADCTSLLLADGQGRVVAAHAGWRGTVGDMAGAAVSALVSIGARREDIRAALGPSIGPCCFEVQADVADRFAAVFPEAVHRRKGHLYADLWATNRALFLAAGLSSEHVDATTRCTACDSTTFYSYRRDGARIGQHLAFIIGGDA